MKRRGKRLAKYPHGYLRSVAAAAAGLMAAVYLLPAVVILPRAQGAAPVSMEEPAPPSSDAFPKAVIEEKKTEKPAETAENEGEISPEPEKTVLTLHCLLNGEVQELSLEDYLWGVVAAEMPAGFHQEALCAQAVAARTYTRYRMENPTPNHPEADICGDPGCCQAWMSREERLEGWSKSERTACRKKIDKAIRKTEGLTLCYNDQPIMAAFHAASAGSTKSAKEVWGEDYPYLQEVPSPEDEGSVPNYYSTVTVTREEFSETIRSASPEVDLSGDSTGWLGETKYDAAGLPVSLTVGGVEMDTGRLRTLFGLRSASFSAECDGDSVTFYVTGYGHGVGMSQYGANALAKEGKSFREILEWYYPGTELTEIRQ